MRSTFLILILAWAFQAFLPWWTLVFPAAAVGFFCSERVGSAFLQGFFALFLLWFGVALYLSVSNDHLLAGRIGGILGVDQPLLLIAFTALLGGVLGGFATLTGALWRRTRWKREPEVPRPVQ